jgi:hypothetical protein
MKNEVEKEELQADMGIVEIDIAMVKPVLKRSCYH